jgi:hypothetical protein
MATDGDGQCPDAEREARGGSDGKAGQTGTWQRRVTGHTTDRDCLPPSPPCRSVAFLPPFSPPHCCPVAAVVYVVKGASCPASSGQVEPPWRHESGDQSPLVSPCRQGRQPSPLPPLLAPSLSHALLSSPGHLLGLVSDTGQMPKSKCKQLTSMGSKRNSPGSSSNCHHRFISINNITTNTDQRLGSPDARQ